MNMTPFLAETFRKILSDNHAHRLDTINMVNKIIKGKEVILKKGRYKKAKAKIQEYYFSDGKEYLRVITHAGQADLLEYKDCEFM